MGAFPVLDANIIVISWPNLYFGRYSPEHYHGFLHDFWGCEPRSSQLESRQFTSRMGVSSQKAEGSPEAVQPTSLTGGGLTTLSLTSATLIAPPSGSD